MKDDSAERKTTPDDLQGFWDMVSCQVDNVNLKFAQLEELEKSGWVVQEIVPKKKPVKVRVMVTVDCNCVYYMWGSFIQGKMLWVDKLQMLLLVLS